MIVSESNFGVAVRIKLLKMGKTQDWLIEECRSKTGLYLDTGYMWRILSGRRKSPKIRHAICEILDSNESDFDQEREENQIERGVQYDRTTNN